MSKQLYVSVAEKIMADILLENLSPGQKLRSVREYAIKYSVNPKTIQRAFDYLDDINIFYSVVGEGRFLVSNPDIIKQIEKHLIISEVKLFTSKMMTYNLTDEQVISYIRSEYERNNES